jgi:hypothetical protein
MRRKVEDLQGTTLATTDNLYQCFYNNSLPKLEFLTIHLFNHSKVGVFFWAPKFSRPKKSKKQPVFSHFWCSYSISKVQRLTPMMFLFTGHIV